MALSPIDQLTTLTKVSYPFSPCERCLGVALQLDKLVAQIKAQITCQHPMQYLENITDDNDSGVVIALYCTCCQAQFERLIGEEIHFNGILAGTNLDFTIRDARFWLHSNPNPTTETPF